MGDFSVRAVWDDENRIFVPENNIKGLHIEAETIGEFEEVMNDIAGDLLASNHLEWEIME